MPTARVASILEDCLSHRQTREDQFVAALADAPRSVAGLTQELYQRLPDSLKRLAELQTLAGLIKLEREGRATRVEDDWRKEIRQ